VIIILIVVDLQYVNWILFAVLGKCSDYLILSLLGL